MLHLLHLLHFATFGLCVCYYFRYLFTPMYSIHWNTFYLYILWRTKKKLQTECCILQQTQQMQQSKLAK